MPSTVKQGPFYLRKATVGTGRSSSPSSEYRQFVYASGFGTLADRVKPPISSQFTGIVTYADVPGTVGQTYMELYINGVLQSHWNYTGASVHQYVPDAADNSIGAAAAPWASGYFTNLYVGGVAVFNPTIIDAKGDLIVGSADNAVDNLTVGANGTVLTANSSATLGVEWATASGSATTDRKAASESVTSSISLQDDDHIALSVGANEVWSFVIFLNFTNGLNAGGFLMDFSAPVNCAGSYAISVTDESGITVSDSNSQLVDDASIAPTTFTGVEGSGVIHGVIRNGANAGTVTLRWAQHTSNGTATTLNTDTALVAWQH